MKRKIILTTLFFGCCFIIHVYAQKITPAQYIAMHKDMAIQEMIRTGTPASITLAQGILETESGNSALVKKSNNHFGIKCKAEWTGARVYHDDDEAGECFRKYDSVVHSYRDHSDFLRTRSHYAFLYSYEPTDYKSWCYGLKKAGYATNPRYPQILMKTIEDHQLNEYTKSALSQIPDYSAFVIKKNNGNTVKTDTEELKEDKIITPPIDRSYEKIYNGLRAVYADSGTSLLAIATRYKVDLAKVLEFNDFLKDGLLDGPQWVYLQSKRTEARQETHKVKTGETLHQIAQSNGIQLGYLIAYNNLDEEDPLPAGIILKLQSSINLKNSKGTDELQTSSDEASIKYHSVRSNEDLNTIANQYHVSLQNLKKWNRLSSNKVKVGQRLIVSK
jgi:LysM repeat protein